MVAETHEKHLERGNNMDKFMKARKIQVPDAELSCRALEP